MGAGCAEIARLLARVACLDDDAARAGLEQTGGRYGTLCETALERVGSDVAGTPQRSRLDRLAEHALGVPQRFGATGIADTTELGCEVAVGHGSRVSDDRLHDLDRSRKVSRWRQKQRVISATWLCRDVCASPPDVKNIPVNQYVASPGARVFYLDVPYPPYLSARTLTQCHDAPTRNCRGATRGKSRNETEGTATERARAWVDGTTSSRAWLSSRKARRAQPLTIKEAVATIIAGRVGGSGWSQGPPENETRERPPRP